MVVKNRRGDLLLHKNKTVVECNDTVFFHLNASGLMENEMYVSMISFDGGDTYGAITEVEDFLFAVTPQKENDIVVRFYIYRVDSEEICNPSDGEQLYTIRYASSKADSILVELAQTPVKTADGVEYFSGSNPVLKIHPSDAGTIYASVDDGKEVKEYAIADNMLSMKLQEGVYKLDVYTWSEGVRIHAQGFPKVICYDTKAPTDPSFTIRVPKDGGYYPELGKYQYYASGSLIVSAESMDRGSGVEKMYMRIGDGEVKETDSVQIMAPFMGTVYARSVDRAGNASPWVQCAENVRVESRAPEITFDAKQQDGRFSLSGIVRDDSGLRGITITCDDVPLLSYQFEKGGELLKEKEFSFSRLVSSITNKEQIIEIKAADLAGNEAVKQVRTGKSDRMPPVISIEGCGDYDVKKEDVCLRFAVADENLDMSSVEGWAVRLDEDGAAKETIRLTFPETVFTKEGNYDITVRAEDVYGNRAERKWNFMIDKTAPDIQGVKEHDGKVMRSFPPAQNSGIIVSDWSGITYRVYLNGKDYDGRSPVTESGNYVLLVSAEDGAGNTSMQQAQFRIVSEEKRGRADTDASPLEITPEDKKVTALSGKTRGNDTVEKGQTVAVPEKNHALRNLLPFIAVIGVLFLILPGIVILFVSKGNLTQNTGCDRLDT